MASDNEFDGVYAQLLNEISALLLLLCGKKSTATDLEKVADHVRTAASLVEHLRTIALRIGSDHPTSAD